MGWMLHSTRTVLAVSWLPRCPGGERLNTSGLLLLPPLCTLLLLRQTSSHPPRLLLIGWNGLMLLIHVHKVLGQRRQRRPPLFDSNGSPTPWRGDTYTGARGYRTPRPALPSRVAEKKVVSEVTRQRRFRETSRKSRDMSGLSIRPAVNDAESDHCRVLFFFLSF